MEVEFYNRQGQPIKPTRNLVLNDDSEEQFTVTETSKPHKVGHYEENNYFARWNIEDNKLIAKGGKSSSPNLLTQIDRFGLIKLQTDDMSYTVFKFIE